MVCAFTIYERPGQVNGPKRCVDAVYVGRPVRKACRGLNYLVELKSRQQERQTKIVAPVS